jgi:hypothetical protein
MDRQDHGRRPFVSGRRAAAPPAAPVCLSDDDGGGAGEERAYGRSGRLRAGRPISLMLSGRRTGSGASAARLGAPRGWLTCRAPS